MAKKERPPLGVNDAGLPREGSPVSGLGADTTRRLFMFDGHGSPVFIGDVVRRPGAVHLAHVVAAFEGDHFVFAPSRGDGLRLSAYPCSAYVLVR